MKYYTSTQSGFSLVETLVAITILLVVIVGPMTISTSTARSTSFASEKVTAFFLAQEGAELVQKVRDDLILEAFNTGSAPQGNWEIFSGVIPGSPVSTCYNADGCGIHLNTDADASINVVSCASAANCRLYLDDSSTRARFTHSSLGGNESTLYTRAITLTRSGSNDQVQVVSTVTWRSGNLAEEQQVSVETFLHNVYGN
tara:strand:+ start:2743 stop:3342 length:600 start_codon:yes stop_codon:yes gene_type:complete